MLSQLVLLVLVSHNIPEKCLPVSCINICALCVDSCEVTGVPSGGPRNKCMQAVERGRLAVKFPRSGRVGNPLG